MVHGMVHHSINQDSTGIETPSFCEHYHFILIYYCVFWACLFLFFRKLCLNSPYRTFLKEHIRDILETLPTIHGLFLDIVSPIECNCKYCRKEMESLGIEVSVEFC
jgi:hypothetical protein